jgi:hypothetical protein
MIEELKSIIRDERFKVLLGNPELWESKDIDYTRPRVERVWMPINDKRLSLHVIHPCEDGEVYMHKHVWESAMFVLPIGGLYEHTLGYKVDLEDDTYTEGVVCKQISEGAMFYEMMEKSAIHSVRPISLPVYTIMLSGKPIWKENTCTVPKKLVSLSDNRKKEVLQIFKSYY